MWNKSPLIETGCIFEIAIVKTDNNSKKKISAKITEKRKQVEANLAVEKIKIKCIIVIGCRKIVILRSRNENFHFCFILAYINKNIVRKFIYLYVDFFDH